MSLRLLEGDCRALLPTLPAESVQCVVTSPPYWGLRDYGTASWEGGDPGCEHAPEDRGGRFATPVSAKQASNTGSGTISRRDCLCGASRVDQQIGLEATPEAYLTTMVGVFREVRRVLRDDGTLWLNMGDGYAGSWGNQGRKPDRGNQRPINGGMLTPVHDGRYPDKGSNTGTVPDGLKGKDLVGMPWRLALALQADGWYLRADIIWAKPNPMPESVTDRPTKAHEYVFLLTKSARYVYDADAVREPSIDAPGISRGGSLSRFGREEQLISANAHRGNAPAFSNGWRNLRSVWTIATAPYPESHFATFAPELARRCIVAGTSALGCCPVCGAPWERRITVDRDGQPPACPSDAAAWEARRTAQGRSLADDPVRTSGLHGQYVTKTVRTTGWRPTCAHDAAPVPCTVLDPFAGSGTVGEVAEQNGRDAILIELSPAYVTLARARTAQRGLFASPDACGA